MPGPLDLLKKGLNFATTPLVDEETIQPYQDMMDAPILERSPMEARMRGFGAGALEGLRGMTTPLDLAGMAAGGMGALASRMGRGARGVGRAANSFDLVEPGVVQQVAPVMDDVDSLIGDLQRNLAKVPSKRPAPMETLGEQLPEFTPRGGEGLYNVGRQAPTRDPMEGFYQQMMTKMGGRGR